MYITGFFHNEIDKEFDLVKLELTPIESNLVINGTDNGETLRGSDEDDVINGGDGRDSIYANDGDDLVHGDGGNDLIIGGDGNDSLYGDAGNDVIYGNEGDDLIYGGDGNDEIFGGFGVDIIHGGDGNDVIDGDHARFHSRPSGEIFGDAGDDVISGAARLHGGDGNDTINADGANAAFGDAGDDYIYVRTDVSDNRYFGGEGEDRFSYFNYDRVGNGEAFSIEDLVDYAFESISASVLDITHNSGGTDRLVSFESIEFREFTLDISDDLPDLQILSGGNADYLGTSGSEIVFAVQEGQDISTLAGNDIIIGGDGSDVLHGGAGDDYIDGGFESDLIYGGDGNDVLRDGGGLNLNGNSRIIDKLYGGAGDDTFYDEGGLDVMVGQAGDDYFYVLDDRDFDRYNGGHGADTLVYVGLNSAVFLIGRTTNNVVLTIDFSPLRHPSGNGDLAPYVVDQLYRIETLVFDDLTMDISDVSLLPIFAALTEGDDNFTGSDEADLVVGMDGTDYIYGMGGDDILYGDEIFSGGDRDFIYGGDGNDQIYGGDGNNRLFGGNGDDYITWNNSGNGTVVFGDDGNDTIVDPGGFNLVKGGGGDDLIIVQFRGKDDEYDGGTGVDIVQYRDFDPRFVTVTVERTATDAVVVKLAERSFNNQTIDTFDTLTNIEIIKFGETTILVSDLPIMSSLNLSELEEISTDAEFVEMNNDAFSNSLDDLNNLMAFLEAEEGFEMQDVGIWM